MTEEVESVEEVEEVTETTADAQVEAEESQEPEKKGTDEAIQKRIDKLTFKRREAEREAEYWKAKATQAPEPEPVQKAKEKAKSLEDFDYNESEFQEYIFDRAQDGAVEAAKRVLKEDESKSNQDKSIRTFQRKESEFAKDKPDYFEVTRDDTLSMTQTMVDIASDMEDSPSILYHLAKNPELADEIAEMNTRQATRAMYRIEFKLESAQTQAGKKVSDAPPPASKIDAVAAPGKVDLSTAAGDKLSTKEWMKRRNKQITMR